MSWPGWDARTLTVVDHRYLKRPGSVWVPLRPWEAFPGWTAKARTGRPFGIFWRQESRLAVVQMGLLSDEMVR